MVDLPNSGSYEAMLPRNKRIYDEVLAGRFTHGWCEMVLQDEQGNTLKVLVSCDALTMPVRTVEKDPKTGQDVVVEDPRTRITVDAYTQQEIADVLGGLLLTPKLVDEIYRQTPVKIPPQTGRQGPRMATTAEMIRHSQDVDRWAAGHGVEIPPAISNVGKHWVISNTAFLPGKVKLNRSVNYGWLGTGGDRSVTGLPIIQSQGTHHTAGRPGTAGHTDYSQVSAFVHRAAQYNELPVDLADVYTGKAPGNHLVSHDGPMPAARLPQFTGELPEPQPEPTPEGGGGRRGGGAGSLILGGLLGGTVGWAFGGPTGAAIGGVAGGVIASVGRRA